MPRSCTGFLGIFDFNSEDLYHGMLLLIIFVMSLPGRRFLLLGGLLSAEQPGVCGD